MVLFNHKKTKTKQKEANLSMAHFIIDTYKMKWEILNFARSFSVQGNKFWLLRTFVSAAWSQATHWISTLWLRCLSLPKWPEKPPQMRCWNPSCMRPGPLKTRYIFCTIVFRMESQRYWNTPELESVTGSSQIAQTKTSSTSDFQRDSTPIFSTRRKDKMPLRLVGVPFLVNMGN